MDRRRGSPPPRSSGWRLLASTVALFSFRKQPPQDNPVKQTAQRSAGAITQAITCFDKVVRPACTCQLRSGRSALTAPLCPRPGSTHEATILQPPIESTNESRLPSAYTNYEHLAEVIIA
ncbi:unnamed protein product [Chrysodeixis includens]|uniref:Uncharacterized protein n=1 Tax=Chrysodeixis includens TaxID=689277 RepID=A0A9N8PWY8_CHRIL|nr:unnamed protein product [Chrysodeixis includens]